MSRVEHGGGQEVSWLELRCSPYTQSSPLYPVIELIELGLEFRPEDSSDDKLGRLERGLA